MLQAFRDVVLVLLFLSLSADRSLANDSGWSGCGPVEDPNAALTIGERTVICLQVGNNVDWGGTVQYLRLSFSPEVDQYSRFHVPNSFLDLVQKAPSAWQNRNITVGVASQQTLSFLRLYYQFTAAGTGTIYPYLTAIIDVDKGRVRGITWDDACVFCGGFECQPITYNYDGVLQTSGSAGQSVGGCPMTLDECQTDPTACDVLLYVVWTGSDAEGNAFQSGANRFSTFPAQDWGNRLSQAVNDVANAAGTGNTGNTGETGSGSGS
ncbi:hypothetical protein ACA910_005644 [Epithemia clementina (nom. ined.)]